jgi:hypothetical protein
LFDTLRTFLKNQLPHYMIPSTVVVLDKLPLNANGKVNRQALPAPDIANSRPAGTFVAPRNHTEELLAQICVQLLGIEHIGVYDNFFERGGHSLLASRFIARIRQVFPVELSLRDFFEYPTIANLAQLVMQRAAPQQSDPIERLDRGEEEALLTNLDQLSPEALDELLNSLLSESKI